MSQRKIIVSLFSLALLLTAFVIPYLAEPNYYSLVERFLPYFYSGIAFVILAILSLIILTKKDLTVEVLSRRVVGILCPYLYFSYLDFQLYHVHHSPTGVIWYMVMIIIMLPALFVMGFGITYIIQDYKKHEKDELHNKINK